MRQCPARSENVPLVPGNVPLVPARSRSPKAFFPEKLQKMERVSKSFLLGEPEIPPLWTGPHVKKRWAEHGRTVANDPTTVRPMSYGGNVAFGYVHDWSDRLSQLGYSPWEAVADAASAEIMRNDRLRWASANSTRVPNSSEAVSRSNIASMWPWLIEDRGLRRAFVLYSRHRWQSIAKRKKLNVDNLKIQVDRACEMVADALNAKGTAVW